MMEHEDGSEHHLREVMDNPEWSEDDVRARRPLSDFAPELADNIARVLGRPAEPSEPLLTTVDQAASVLEAAWPMIIDECRAMLGSELHYQAVVYHSLRVTGVPRMQIGMNVKQWITDPVTPLFRQLDARKHELYRGGFEPIPDIVLFKPEIGGDWRRRRRDATLKYMLLAIEVKASERDKGRLRAAETIRDVHKLAAHRDEVRHRGGDMHPVVLIIDTAVEASERMRDSGLNQLQNAAREHGVTFYYVSAEKEISPKKGTFAI